MRDIGIGAERSCIPYVLFIVVIVLVFCLILNFFGGVHSNIFPFTEIRSNSQLKLRLA